MQRDSARVIASVQHRKTKEEVSMEDVVITDKFTLVQPWDDLHCRFEGRTGFKVVIADLFPRDAAFRELLSKAATTQRAKQLELEWQQGQQKE
eukprot:9375212-Lingulodinium_polyedra.AAC.1